MLARVVVAAVALCVLAAGCGEPEGDVEQPPAALEGPAFEAQPPARSDGDAEPEPEAQPEPEEEPAVQTVGGRPRTKARGWSTTTEPRRGTTR